MKHNKIEQTLKSTYIQEYNKIKKMLKEDVKYGAELEDTLNGIFLLLSDAQREGLAPNSIYGGDFEYFYRDILEALSDSYTIEEKQLKKRTKNIIIVSLSLVIVAFIVFFVLWENGTIGAYSRGMAFLMEDSSYSIYTQNLDLVVESEIDLSNIENNTGKTIYNDGQCKIDIALVKKEATDDYNIFFRTHGYYNRLGGTLISPTRQQITEGRLYTYDFVGKMQVIIDGVAYDCSNSASSSLIFKDGDEFGFYLFPLEGYEKGNFLLKDKLKKQNNKVKIRLFNLSKTVWTRN